MILKNRSFKSRMGLLVGLFLLGLLATHAMYWVMILSVRVNGPLYRDIVQDKDIVADVLPPPQYIIESYLVVLQMIDATDANTQEDLIDKFRQKESEYSTRHDFWQNELAEGNVIKKKLVGESNEWARKFYDEVNEEVIKPLKGGASPDELESVVQGTVKDYYDQHRLAVEEVVNLANSRIADDEKKAEKSITGWTITQLVFGVLVLAVLGIISWIIVRGIVEPTSGLIDRMNDMAEGAADLTKRVNVESADEIGKLAELINAVIQRIHDLIARVKVASIQLNSTATQIAAAAGEQNSTMQGFNASTSEIAASVKQISATSQQLLTTVEDVHSRAHETSGVADSGRSGLSNMESTMEQLSEATGSISSKLGMIREKAGSINVVVETITKVADQTNLLSINAAIEAEKAGEAGRGFLVVSREIRRLADQTAVATLDIEQMVRQMQDAVSAGVMEMDKFSEQVRACIAQVAEISGQMGEIIEQVHVLGDRFHAVNEGMSQQSQGARQIDDAMAQLVTGVHQVSGTVNDFNAAAENLRRSASELQQEVGQFKVAS
jgi:methyl-accepting chemotaxis protein WspA